VPKQARSNAPVGVRSEPRVREEVYRAYWHFAYERHGIYERRLSGDPTPWTKDEVLQQYRFCNAFRASDRVSQYLIRNVVYGDDELTPADRFLRTVLFRLFSKPETWELIEARCGSITATSFDQEQIGSVLDAEMKSGRVIYTAAFILCANSAYGHERKHRNHLALVDAMMSDELPEHIVEAKSLEKVYGSLREYPLIGPFMAYQLAIDLNYGPDIDFDEDEFTIPGPGAERGLHKVFEDLGDYSPAEAIHWLVDQQDSVEETLGISAPRLHGRPLHAIDCQNLLCEVDKYARVKFPELASNRTRIKQTFAPAGDLPAPFYPPSWGLKPESKVSQRESQATRSAHAPA
jgi:hypothetical protein